MTRTTVDTRRLADTDRCDQWLQSAVINLRRAIEQVETAHGIATMYPDAKSARISDWLQQLKRLEREIDDESARGS